MRRRSREKYIHSMLTVRKQRDDDREAVRRCIAEAFRRPRVGDLAEALLAARAGADGLSYVAEQDGSIVGHGLLTRSWLDTPARLVDVLVLSPLSVAPAHQRQGVGGRLVRHAIDEAGRFGAPLLFLEGSPDYYSRFGFERAGAYGFTPPSVRIPDVAFQVVRLPGYESWMTGALVYAEQFWEFDSVGRRASS
jgi:putative acetyltransferase